jgi:hypothetical protein
MLDKQPEEHLLATLEQAIVEMARRFPPPKPSKQDSIHYPGAHADTCSIKMINLPKHLVLPNLEGSITSPLGNH